MKIQSKELKSILSKLKPVAGKNIVIPATEYVKIDKGVFTMSNTHTTISVNTDIKSDNPIYIKFEDLQRLSSISDVLTFETVKKGKSTSIKVKTDNGVFNLSCIDDIDKSFPDSESYSATEEIDVDEDIIDKLKTAASFADSNNVVMPAFNTVFWNGKEGDIVGGTITMIYKTKGANGGNYLIPKEIIQCMDGVGKIGFSDKKVFFNGENITISTVGVEAKYANYQQIFKTKREECEVSLDLLKSYTLSASIIATTCTDKRMRIIPDKKTISIFVKNEDINNEYSSPKIPINGNFPDEIWVNILFIQDALKVLSNENVIIKIKDHSSPIILEEDDTVILISVMQNANNNAK